MGYKNLASAKIDRYTDIDIVISNRVSKKNAKITEHMDRKNREQDSQYK